jgi:hypothetical protein
LLTPVFPPLSLPLVYQSITRMKWSFAVPILCASLAYAVSDIVIKSRQAVARRGFTTDVCAHVDDNLSSEYGNDLGLYDIRIH